jgi:hypothetical protein
VRLASFCEKRIESETYVRRWYGAGFVSGLRDESGIFYGLDSITGGYEFA